jgi:hypothetical protein
LNPEKFANTDLVFDAKLGLKIKPELTPQTQPCNQRLVGSFIA